MSNTNQTASAGGPPSKISDILIPIDMRQPDASGLAVGWAAWFARQTGARIHVLTVAHPFGDSITDMPERHKPAFQAFVAGLADQHGCEIDAIFRSHESIDHVIRQVVDANAIDFVVMATHHPRLTDHLFGSHASQTALHNNCSVLILRGDDKAD